MAAHLGTTPSLSVSHLSWLCSLVGPYSFSLAWGAGAGVHCCGHLGLPVAPRLKVPRGQGQGLVSS